MRAVYLGVWRYGEADVRRENAAHFQYRFLTDDGERLFRIGLPEEGDACALQNRLKVGYAYRIDFHGDELTGAECTQPAVSPVPSPVRGRSGICTLSNLLKTAMEPVGRVLYVFGGGWNWQDTGAHENARHIGISSDWQRFFDEQDKRYTYRDPDGDEKKKDACTSYYPYGGFNQYGYAGLDCSGYIGWTIYNTLHEKSGETGFVSNSTGMAKKLSACGYGDWFKPAAGERPLLCPGDIVSISGHVYMALGTCADGSVLIAHSTPSPSRAGQPGGGVQIGAVGTDGSCAAYRMADGILRSVYPAWYRRYPACLKEPAVYFDFTKDDAGVFRWRSGAAGGLTDPDGVQDMTADAVRQMLFGSL